MNAAFEYRAIPSSPVSHWDARWKLTAILVAAFGIAALDHLLPASAALLLGLLLLAGARLPFRWVRARLALFAFAALPFPLVLPFTLDPAGPGWKLGPAHFSEHGLVAGLAVFCRCLAIGSLTLVLLGTAPLHHTLAAANRLCFPGPLVLLTGLAYRYAFLLGDELRRIRIALRTRGFRMRTSRHGYQTLGHVTGAVLVRGADRADRVAAAMRCRGFDGRFHTTMAFRTTFADALACAGLIAAIAALIAWDQLGSPP
jgi:cobalt/nickel transport system permease protein